MKFKLTDEQKMVRKTMHEFAVNEAAPIAGELDKRGEFPTEILEKLAKLGLFGLTMLEEYGSAVWIRLTTQLQ